MRFQDVLARLSPLILIVGSSLIGTMFMAMLSVQPAAAQPQSESRSSDSAAQPNSSKDNFDSIDQQILQELQNMRDRIQQLEAQLKQRHAGHSLSYTDSEQPASSQSQKLVSESKPSGPADDSAVVAESGTAKASSLNLAEESTALAFLKDTTLNLTVDGYYAYNFNHPVGRVNLLRAYDVLSNSFSLNQASVVLERAPNVAAGRSFGARIDLQFGQATETLQGSAANETRPQTYRPVFQAYGTYVAPLGRGLTVDFGKWASAMGYENNYSKDQLNYSRSYFFNFLPFYHMGFRTTYSLNDRLTLGYWLVNGTQQTEDFNGFKSQVVQVTAKPTKTLQWNLIYHVGEEQRDLIPALNPGLSTLPTQPGLSVTPVLPTPNGRLHILDTYASWSVSPKLTLVGEADYVINRQFEHSSPAHVTGGAAYAHYQVTPRVALTGRAEYLSDRGGLFSGVTQALKEATLTYEYRIADGLIARTEWRRDFSNQPFFLTETAGVLKKEQNTATLGLIWWWGRKEGPW